MIPRHSLPFGIGTALAVLAAQAPAVQVSDLEKAYADALGLHSAILLPSVRAGIHMVIQSLNKPDMIVAGPAYTCHTVHEALALSGAHTQLVDSAPDSFLMPIEDIEILSTIKPVCALVLSEVYGIPYDLKMLRNADKKGHRVSILDMAMCIPSQERMQQLEAMDVALFSFGWGKPMYAGWGGIACFQDLELAGKIREIRDRWTTPDSVGQRFQRDCSTFFRVVMNQRRLYGLSHEQHLYRLYKNIITSRNEQGFPPTTHGDALQPVPGLSLNALPSEWKRPMTPLNRKLALRNLRHSVQNAELRRSQAEIYSRSLVESGIVRGPGNNTLPQSHFPIRLPSAVRNTMCDYLRVRGIDTSTLFPLPAGLSQEHYPHAAEAADEVVTLPMGPTITLDEVRMVSQRVKDGLQALGC